jgi:hypothetical protein
VAIQIVDCRNLRLRFPIAMGSTVAKMFNLVTKKRGRSYFHHGLLVEIPTQAIAEQRTLPVGE